MFIKGHMNQDSGYEAENLVWEEMERTFASRESFAFWHYPMFDKNHSHRREIDVLVVDKEIGVTIIEVKGISIKQIQSISGKVWTCKKDGKIFEIEPYAQGERQMDMLCRDIEENPLLYRKFGRRTIVALPYITRGEWKERGFEGRLNMPPILFKDDLGRDDTFEIIKNVSVWKSPTPLSGPGWAAMKKYFDIADAPNAPSSVEKLLESKGVFSLTYYLPDVSSFSSQEASIQDALHEGKKVYLFAPFEMPSKFHVKHRPFVKKHQLQFHRVSSRWTGQPLSIHKNGNLSVDMSMIAEDSESFNAGQYAAIHAPSGENLKIMAGAGTGKTHVMIDRIMYLIESEGVELKDIVMITFTNESTNEMRHRFQKKMLSMFALTRKKRYLELAEDVKNMQISTIHAYSKSILTDLAHEIGFGLGMKIRSFIKAKDEIIERLADEYFAGNPATGGMDRLVTINLDHHRITRIIRLYWDEMEKKGLTREEIERIDWGSVLDARYATLHDLFRFVFMHCESRLERLKRQENAIDMGDMIRKLRWFTENKKMNQLRSNKYLFVDEFQDSDNTQIELVSSLHDQLGYTIFVVGDVKQSIYRFRGADYTSFERLEGKVATPFKEIHLNKNYRTTSSLLDRLDTFFLRWGDEGNDLLPYSTSDRLIGVEKTMPSVEEFQDIKVKSKLEVDEMMLNQVRVGLDEIASLEDDERIAVLVRTNGQAKQVAEVCEAAGIPVKQNLEGMFFRSDAVMHFKSLLAALMYPNEATHLITALESPYFAYRIPSRLLVGHNGDGRNILRYVEEKIGDDFSRYLADMRRLPMMAVIQRIISEKGLSRNLPDYYEQFTENPEIAQLKVRQYELDLAHLTNILHQQFGPDTSTLWAVHRWLELQVRVNRTENSPMDSKHDGQLEITTIHRAKGLEYHTILLPKLDFPFMEKKNTFLIEEEKSGGSSVMARRVGWYMETDGVEVSSEFYEHLDTAEKDEIRKEETRLLYVALTRAKKKIILVRSNFRKDTWSDLLDKAMGGRSHVR